MRLFTPDNSLAVRGRLLRQALAGSFLTLLVLLLPWAARAQAPTFAAAVSFNPTGISGSSTSQATATDAAGNQYVTGEFTNTLALGSTTLVSAGGQDVFVAKRSASTGAWLWAVRFGGSGTDYGYGIAVDASGNALVTGSFIGTASFATSPTATSLVSAGSSDVFVAKFVAADGACAWAVRAGSFGLDQGYGIAVDGGGNALVTGYFDGVVGFATSPTATSLVSAGGNDVFVARFGAATGACAWAVHAGGGDNDSGLAIAVDASGNALVTGAFGSAASFATSPTATILNSPGSSGVFVARFAAATGACAWAVRAGGTGTDAGLGIAVDGGGNALVTGYFQVTASFATSPTATSLVSAGNYDVFVAKFAAATGGCAWAVRAGGSGNDLGVGLAVDGGGNALVTGYFTGTASFATSPTATSLVSVGSNEVFVARFGAVDGACAWAVQAGGSGGKAGSGIAVDSGGNALVTGYFTGTAVFGSTTLVGGSGGVTGFAVRVGSGPVVSSVSPVSLTHSLIQPFTLFPNPARGGAVTLTGAQPGTVVTVFDALGRPVLSATADAAGTTRLMLPAGQPVGVYVVRAGSKAVRLTVE